MCSTTCASPKRVRAGAEPFFGFDEGVDDVVPFQPGPQQGDGPPADPGFEGVAGCHPDAVGFGLPALPEHFGGQGAVLAGPGGQGRRVVDPHPLFRGGVIGAGAGEVFLDGLGALGERPQPSRVEPDHLPASVAVRPPLHPQPFSEAAAEFLLIHRPGRPAPLVERRCIEGGVRPARTAPQVGHHAVGVQLHVAVAAGAVHEGGRRHPGGDPLADTVDLLAGCARPPLQEIEGDRHRLHVGDRRRRRHLGGGERPQQRHRLRRREGDVVGREGPGPTLRRQQRCVGGRVPPQEQRPELVRVDHAGQAELGRQPALPNPRRLTGADVIVLHAQGDPAEEVLRVGQARDR